MRRVVLLLACVLLSRSASAQNITDSFNRADSSTTLGNTDTGQTWSALSGTWGITSNTAYVATQTGNVDVAVVESGVADTTITVTYAVFGGNAGLIFRATDINNFYLANVDGSAPQCTLQKNVGGSFTTIDNVPCTAVNGSIMSVVLSGTSITVKLDGVTKITHTDSTYTTQTKHGMFAYTGADTTSQFDTFSITRPAAASRSSLTLLGVGPR